MLPEEVEDELPEYDPQGEPPPGCPWIVKGGAIVLFIVTVAMGAINVPRRILHAGTVFFMKRAPWITRLVHNS